MHRCSSRIPCHWRCSSSPRSSLWDRSSIAGERPRSQAASPPERACFRNSRFEAYAKDSALRRAVARSAQAARQKIRFADLDAIVAQKPISGRDMVIEIRQPDIGEILGAFDGQVLAACLEGDRPLARLDELLLVEAAEVVDRL